MDDFEKDLVNQLKKPVKKPKKVEASEILPAPDSEPVRKSMLRPDEREFIRKQLVQFYGSSKVEKFMGGLTKAKDISERLIDLRDRMTKDVETAQADSEQYFNMIDIEYKKIGRPNAPFTWREFDYLCSLGCPIVEIAGFFDLHKDTLRKKVKDEYGITFTEYYDRRSQGIKIAIRRAQIHSAINGDTSMQKFLGKNLLGQKDKIDFDGQVQVNTFADLVKNLDNKARGITNGNDNKVSDDEDGNK